MLRCASLLVIAAYLKVRLTPHNSRALPAELLQSRYYNYNLEFSAFNTMGEKGERQWELLMEVILSVNI
jgi:hypothetical protein